MKKNIAIGIQSFEELIEKKCFYIDKTDFIKEWWDSNDSVTLITRPRRFGKTLNMSMLEQFFSMKYADKKALFEGFSIWQYEEYRSLQGTYPVINLSFANVKEKDFQSTKQKIFQIIRKLYADYEFLLESDKLSMSDREWMKKVLFHMEESEASSAIHYLSKFLYQYYGKKVIILLDEYDTPMQEAYIEGFWDELAAFTRSMFNSTFKTNPYLERAMMTGITRIRESGFGRYDVMLEPLDKSQNALILEFKVYNPRRESSLEETVEVALKQIEDKQYEASLIQKGFKKEQICKYGFAFEGKKVLIGEKS